MEDLEFVYQLKRIAEFRKKHFPKDEGFEMYTNYENKPCVIFSNVMYTGKTMKDVVERIREHFSEIFLNRLLDNEGFVDKPTKEELNENN